MSVKIKIKIKEKSNKGQFYTKNYEYILQDFQLPDAQMIEPFAGEGHLVDYIHTFYPSKDVESYDIDKKLSYIIERDTILNPPSFHNKYVVTNPPYLARNKSDDKTYYDKYNTNDLYKCFIRILINDPVIGGIIIIPLNFLSSIRQTDINLRKDFLSKYMINKINIFEETVFDDTTYTVCSMQFTRILPKDLCETIACKFLPSNDIINVCINEKSNFMIGGEIYNLPTKGKYTISRLLQNQTKNTNILVKCIDDNNEHMIGASYVSNDKIYVDNTSNSSARSYMTLVIHPEISENAQKTLCDKFNNFLNEQRGKYHSLFLSNYRESNVIARKRISFGLVYQIMEYILDTF